MTNRQRLFVIEYLQCWNATEAARRAGYKHPNQRGPELVVKSGILEAIEQALSEKAMSADEVLYRLSAMARADISEFIKTGGGIDWNKVGAKGFLIKKIKHQPGMNSEIELYDAQTALVQLGKHHQLFTERIEHTGPDGGDISVRIVGGINLDDDV